jgi:hypothetical protein
MPFVVYLVIAVTAVFSVALEWDSLVVNPDKDAREVRVVSTAPKPPVERDSAKLTDVPHPVQPANPQTAATTANPPPAPAAPPRPGAVAPANAGVQIGVEADKTAAAPPLCDVNACAAAYHSFRASDCTYQPGFGARRLCGKRAPQVAAADAHDEATPGAAHCHVEVCAQAYSSFSATDCTYQPFGGPRRVCEK